MNQSELRDLLTVAGWASRTKGDEVVLETCYFCGNDKWNLELNAEKGLFSCWACRSGGRLEALLLNLTGQRYHIPVAQGAPRTSAARVAPQEFTAMPVRDVISASYYLNRRGVDADLASTYGMVLCTQKGHLLEDRIAIPARDFWTGSIVGWVGRSYTGKRPKYLSTLPTKQICGWFLRRPGTPAVVVEGLLDAIAVHQAGFSAAALLGTNSTGIIEWASRLGPEYPVVVMLDGSAVEQARRIYWQLQVVRPVLYAQLPVDSDPASIGPVSIRALVHHLLSEPARTESGPQQPTF